MQIFLDTVNIEDIKELNNIVQVAGVTTNPSLVAKSGQNYKALLKEITKIIAGSVSAEVISTDCKDMLKEADQLLEIAENITIKLPLTVDGLKACRVLSQNGASVNVTLCFSANQALMAARAGAQYVSPFIGRLDDIGQNGMDLICDIKQIFDNYDDIPTQIIAASVRNTTHITQAAEVGADIVTAPPKLFLQMIQHPLTDKGLEIFLKDWRDAGYSSI